MEIGDVSFKALDHDCKDIVMSPVDNQILYLTSDKRFFRSIDRGDNWTLINGTVHQEIEIHPQTPTSSTQFVFQEIRPCFIDLLMVV
ncbi:MAG: hypothetical protein JKY42_04485 [Flavobacteriales bacterium]|nr:hypothetical protein [Flavobacteriales bacterium]